MGDKDTNMLFGNCAIFIGASEIDMKPLKVVENSVSLHPEDMADSLRVKPLSLSCDFQMPIDDSLSSFFGADFGSEPSKQVCSLVIEGNPIVNKPRNLKYPNKKRARRVWKKWAKRYGTSPGKTIYLPNVEVESEYNGGCVNVNVKPIKDKNNES